MRLRGARLGLSLVGLLCAEPITDILGAVVEEDPFHAKDIEIADLAISTGNLRHVETIWVQASPETTGPGSAGQFTLSGNDLENLATVLADDPLRSVQSLPGVSSNDDFEARFSVRGADFNRIGVYLDGIRLHGAVHNLEGTDLSGSASILNTALIRQIDFYDGAHSESFGDTSAGVLDIRMREGNRDRYSFQSTVNLGSAGIAANGPLGKLKRCTWTAGFRKSYLQYILAQTLSDPSMAFGIEDGEGRLSCHASPKNSFALDVIDSYTGLDRSSLRDTLGANALMKASQHFAMQNLSWTYTPSDKLLIANSVGTMRDTFDAQDPIYAPLGTGAYRERVWNSEATWLWNSNNSFSAGFTSRWMHDTGFVQQYDTVRRIELLDRYNGGGVLMGGYLQNSWTGWKRRLHATASARWDRHSIDRVTAFSPQMSVTIGLLPSLDLQAGWGQYTQFPDISVFTSNLGAPSLLPLRSIQATVALQETIGSNTRVRVEFYDRQDRDLAYQPYADPRIVDGVVFLPPLDPSYANSLRGYGRGVEAYLQRNMGKGVTGWVSLSYGSTRMRDGVTNISFPSDSDQRYTSNTYLNYRMRPSVTLSARWTYGSGFPAPGFFTVRGPVSKENFYLSSGRNQVRIGPYQRVDFRVNKAWDRGKWKKTLYAEVMNVTNKANYRFGSLDGYRLGDGAAYVTVDQMFPILPSVGFVLQR